MEPLGTFCLAALVFLSLPLPLFAGAALGEYPSARRSLLPWVWGNAAAGAFFGLLLVATALPPLALLGSGAAVFVLCGMQMTARLARCIGEMSHAQGASGSVSEA
jgi:hypothetical protein